MKTITLSEKTFKELQSVFGASTTVDSSLFNEKGFRISSNLKENTIEPNTEYCVTQPREEIIKVRLKKQCALYDIDFTETQEKVAALLLEIKANPKMANLLNSPYFPIVIPKMVIDDYGTTLEKMLKRLETAYTKQFSVRVLNNYPEGKLKNEVTIVDPGHQKLVELTEQCAIVALYFPVSLQGFSVKAQREQTKDLPGSFSLGGGVDTITAHIMYPDILDRDFYCPVYDLSALQWRDAEYSLYLSPSGAYVDFGYRALLGNAFDNYSGGLSFVE